MSRVSQASALASLHDGITDIIRQVCSEPLQPEPIVPDADPIMTEPKRYNNVNGVTCPFCCCTTLWRHNEQRKIEILSRTQPCYKWGPYIALQSEILPPIDIPVPGAPISLLHALSEGIKPGDALNIILEEFNRHREKKSPSTAVPIAILNTLWKSEQDRLGFDLWCRNALPPLQALTTLTTAKVKAATSAWISTGPMSSRDCSICLCKE